MPGCIFDRLGEQSPFFRGMLSSALTSCAHTADSLVSISLRVPSPRPSSGPFGLSLLFPGKNVREGWNTWGTKDKVAKSHKRSSKSSIPCAEEACI